MKQTPIGSHAGCGVCCDSSETSITRLDYSQPVCLRLGEGKSQRLSDANLIQWVRMQLPVTNHAFDVDAYRHTHDRKRLVDALSSTPRVVVCGLERSL